MHPILLHIDAFTVFGSEWGPWDLHSYGAMVALAFAVGLWVGMRAGKQEDIPLTKVFDFGFWTLIAGIVGARLLFSLVFFEDYVNACFHPELPNALAGGMPLKEADCLAAFSPWGGGLVWYGGLLGALLGATIYIRRHKLGAARMLDIALLSVPLGHFFGRLGCLLAGCCYGHPTDGLVGLLFPPDALAYVTDGLGHSAWPRVPLHPTQLYEALGELSIFLILLLIWHRRRFHGQVALGFFVLYPILRSVVEFFRGDQARGFIIGWPKEMVVNGETISLTVGFSVSQLISLLVAAGALFWMWRLLKGRDQG